jgi:hypothetical protein
MTLLKTLPLLLFSVSCFGQVATQAPVIWRASCASGIFNLATQACLEEGGGGGDPTIGNAVIDADPNRILFTDPDGNLSQSENLTYSQNSNLNEVETIAYLDAGPIQIIANNAGSIGNITIPFDEVSTVDQLVDAWNTANPTNTVTVLSGGSIVPLDTLFISGGGTFAFFSGEYDSQKGHGLFFQDGFRKVVTQYNPKDYRLEVGQWSDDKTTFSGMFGSIFGVELQGVDQNSRLRLLGSGQLEIYAQNSFQIGAGDWLATLTTATPENGQVLKYDADFNQIVWGTGSGGMEIDAPVVNADAHNILFTDLYGNLTQDRFFNRNKSENSYRLTGGYNAVSFGSNSSDEEWIILALRAGSEANQIVLVGDGVSTVDNLISTWNEAPENAENQLQGIDGTSAIPDLDQEIVFSGGLDDVTAIGGLGGEGLNGGRILSDEANDIEIMDGFYNFGTLISRVSTNNGVSEIRLNEYDARINSTNLFLNNVKYPNTTPNNGDTLIYNAGDEMFEYGQAGLPALQYNTIFVGDLNNEPVSSGNLFYADPPSESFFVFGKSIQIGKGESLYSDYQSQGAQRSHRLAGRILSSVDTIFNGSGLDDIVGNQYFGTANSETFTVSVIEDDAIVLDIQSIVTEFQVGEIVTGSDSGTTGTIVGIENGGTRIVISDATGSVFDLFEEVTGNFGGEAIAGVSFPTDLVDITSNLSGLIKTNQYLVSGTINISVGNDLIFNMNAASADGHSLDDEWEISFGSSVENRITIDFLNDSTIFGNIFDTRIEVLPNSDILNFRATHINMNLQAFDSDADAGSGGLNEGDLYVTSGAGGSAPFDVPGIVMRKLP